MFTVSAAMLFRCAGCRFHYTMYWQISLVFHISLPQSRVLTLGVTTCAQLAIKTIKKMIAAVIFTFMLFPLELFAFRAGYGFSGSCEFSFPVTYPGVDSAKGSVAVGRGVRYAKCKTSCRAFRYGYCFRFLFHKPVFMDCHSSTAIFGARWLQIKSFGACIYAGFEIM